MTDKLKDIREGDTVDVTFRGVVLSAHGGGLVTRPHTVGYSCSVSFYLDEVASPHFSIKKAEKPLAVGDRVRGRHITNASRQGTLLCINADMAWVAWGATDFVPAEHATVFLADLERVS